MGKLNKQSSGVGKYLKYRKEKVTGGNLPNVIQQTKCGARLNREYTTSHLVNRCTQ